MQLEREAGGPRELPQIGRELSGYYYLGELEVVTPQNQEAAPPCQGRAQGTVRPWILDGAPSVVQRSAGRPVLGRAATPCSGYYW